MRQALSLCKTSIQKIQANDGKRGGGSPSKFGLGIDQRCIVLQDPSRIVNHVIDDLLSGEDLVYLGSDTTSEPWSGTDRLFRVLFEIVFYWDDTLLEESLGFSLTIFHPIRTA